MEVKVGISIGDANGIGPELILRTFAVKNAVSNVVPIIYGSTEVLNQFAQRLGLKNLQFL